MDKNLRPIELLVKDYIREGNLEKIKSAIVDRPELLNFRDQFGYTYLYTSAAQERLDICKLLIELGMDANDIDTVTHDDTPLSTACRTANFELIALFLNEGANPNFGRTAFSLISSHKSNMREVFELLIKHGLDVNQVFLMFDDPNKRRTALDFAGSNEDVVAVLKNMVQRKLRKSIKAIEDGRKK